MSEAKSSVQEAAGALTSLYVAPDFTHWECEWPDAFSSDLTINGTAYRALDPEYYAWLRYRMTQAKEAHVAGKMRDETFQDLRAAFNQIHAWAMARFPEQVLLRAIERLRPKYYDLPRVFGGGIRGEGREENAGHAHPVSPEALAQVDAIRDMAVSLGWSHDDLYSITGRYAFPCGREYGLVCSVSKGRRIGEVTAESIEVIHEGRGSVLRFYRRR
jgi:hypothetical protein